MKSMTEILALHAESLDDDYRQANDEQGTYRVGLGGIYDDGMRVVAGKCPRAACLQRMGIYPPRRQGEHHLMLAGGKSNEDLWASALEQQGIEFKREEEAPTCTNLGHGIKVSGRPDFVLCNGEGRATKGLELKLICSVWTALDVLKGNPKLDHIIQAAHYARALGIPFELWYTSRVNWSCFKGIPRGPEIDECYAYKVTKGIRTPYRINPFTRGFRVVEIDGNVSLHDLLTGERKATIVSAARNEAYYRLVHEMLTTQNLRWDISYEALDYEGSKESYKACDYCDYGLQDVCARCPSFEQFVEAARQG
jgi:hypothetical protein